MAYTTFADELRGEHVIHWIDNESAVYSLVKGYSRAPDSACCQVGHCTRTA